MIGAAVAAHQGLYIMTLDNTAAYLNAEIKGPPLETVRDVVEPRGINDVV